MKTKGLAYAMLISIICVATSQTVSSQSNDTICINKAKAEQIALINSKAKEQAAEIDNLKRVIAKHESLIETLEKDIADCTYESQLHKDNSNLRNAQLEDIKALLELTKKDLRRTKLKLLAVSIGIPTIATVVEAATVYFFLKGSF